MAAGLVWSIKGAWQRDGGDALLAGNPVDPGNLLQPDNSDQPHSIAILMPDGQRLFYTCTRPTDCARGFRVPPLNGTVTTYAQELLNGVRSMFAYKAVLTRPVAPRTVPAMEDEMVAVLSLTGQVSLTGIAAGLPPGHYTYDLYLRSSPRSGLVTTAQHLLPFDKTNTPVSISLPQEGIYEVRIQDAGNSPRVDLLIAAVTQRNAQRYDRFTRAQAMLEEWSEAADGWPKHMILRLYLLKLAQPVASR